MNVPDTEEAGQQAPLPGDISIHISLRKEVFVDQSRPLPSLPPTVFDRAVEKVVVSIKDWRFNRAKAALEHELARIIETANGHQAKHLPTGAPAYVALYQQASTKIDAFCAKHRVERLSIERAAPALRELEHLTHVAPPGANVVKGLGLLIAVVVGAILLGGASGLVSAGHHWIVTLLAR